MTANAEALAALELVAFRRLGANRVHFALVMPSARVAGSHWGAACTIIATPVVAFCGRTLRGQAVEIPDDYLDGWKRGGHVCSECRMVALVAAARAESDS